VPSFLLLRCARGATVIHDKRPRSGRGLNRFLDPEITFLTLRWPYLTDWQVGGAANTCRWACIAFEHLDMWLLHSWQGWTQIFCCTKHSMCLSPASRLLSTTVYPDNNALQSRSHAIVGILLVSAGLSDHLMCDSRRARPSSRHFQNHPLSQGFGGPRRNDRWQSRARVTVVGHRAVRTPSPAPPCLLSSHVCVTFRLKRSFRTS
jgi:hypothetical protein